MYVYNEVSSCTARSQPPTEPCTVCSQHARMHTHLFLLLELLKLETHLLLPGLLQREEGIRIDAGKLGPLQIVQL